MIELFPMAYSIGPILCLARKHTDSASPLRHHAIEIDFPMMTGCYTRIRKNTQKNKFWSASR